MRNFTLQLFRLFLFGFLLFGATMKVNAWGGGNYVLISENTTDGFAAFHVQRYLNGNLINHNLYLEANIEGVWTTGFRIYHWVDGSNWYNVDQTAPYVYSIRDWDPDGPDYRYSFILGYSPTGVYNSPVSFRLREEGTVRHNFSLTFYKATAPTGLTASKDLCNKVDLSWTAPSNIRVNGNNSYYIYRNGGYIGSTTSTNFSDTSPADGTSYNYTVRVNTVYNNNTNAGILSAAVAGNSKPIPVAPSNVTASNDKCDGTVMVQWLWTAATPDNFEVSRSTSISGSYTVLSSTLPGANNSYTDTPPLKNTNYYYKVRAKNDCTDWGTLSIGAPGYAPAAPSDPTAIASTVNGNIVKITWTDNSFNETKFLLSRINLNTGVTNQYEINPNVTFYDDDKAQLCIPYKYELKAANNCGNSATITTGTVTLTPNLSNTFTTTSLKASKGFFPDVVHLEWDNINRDQINTYYIYRKIYGSNDSTLLTTLAGTLASFDDKYAENGILYTYSIVAEGLCSSTSVLSNVESDIGFRNPSATVSGKVTYGTGEPVQGITITADSNDLLPTSSLALNGTSSYLEIPNTTTNNNIQNNFTFQAYIRPAQIKSFAVFNKGTQYRLNYTGTAFEFEVGANKLSHTHALVLNKYLHIAVVYDGSKSYLYLDGNLMKEQSAVPASANTTAPLIIGKLASSDYFNGHIDEILLWKKALDSTTVKNNFSRYISFRNNDLIGYYRLNENITFSTFFDISKSELNYNENHGTMYNCSYSSVVPDKQQLWFKGLTDIKGDYLITGIPYLTDGSSFNIVPMLAPHEFNPGSKTLFVSDESQVHNNIDFKDISSFMVNGTVVYRNTNLGVAGVQVLVDGALVFGPDAKPEITDNLGRFEIQVPIGFHYISLKKDGHTFDAGGRYPYDETQPDLIGKHNFTQNLTFGKPFVDTTLVTVVGRVIGGTGSNEIPFGFGESVNNLGKATITLVHNSSSPVNFDNTVVGTETIAYTVVNGVNASNVPTTKDISHSVTRTQFETKIFTSPESGEFVARLIPEKFSIVGISVDKDTDRDVENFFGNRVIDLSVNPSPKREYLYGANNKKLDSLDYHLKLNYIYQTLPEISVTNINDTELFYGEKEITYANPITSKTDTILVANHFNYPIFKMLSDYSPKISIYEAYHNYDDNTDSRLAVKEAEIRITNDLAVKNKSKILKLTPAMNGVVVDTFKVGIPNITKSLADGTSFTKTLQINVTVDGNTFPWKPGGDFYRAYIIGQSPKGNNFYTGGPEIPEMILRDPPGSGSSAYIEKGSSYSVSSGFSTDFDNGSGFGAELLLGVEVAAGGGLAGPVIKTDTKNSGKTGLNFSTSINESGKYVETYAFTERIETSSDPGVVGAMGDIYIGKSYNYFYGETDNLKIVPYNLATTNGIIALEAGELKDTKYTLGLVEGFVMSPDNSDTYFKYTQAHILYKLLPELESRRNNLFVTSKRKDGKLKYNSKITKGDMRYGIAQSYDVQVIAGDTIVNGYFKAGTDSIITYSFHPEKITVQDINKIKNGTIYENDSIRYYNTQIGIWIDAIRLNETEKAMAIKNNVLEQNISFDGAVGAISRSETQTIAYEKEESRTKKMHFGAQGSVGFTFNSLGLIATGELSIDHSLGVSSGESFTQSMEYGYTLADGNVGDYYSMNIYRRTKNGVYKATDLEKTKVDMPIGFDFGSLGAGVALVGGGIAVAAASSYNAGGGIPIVAGAAVMAVAAGLSYIPYVSFLDKVKEEGKLFKPGDIRISSFDISSPIFSTVGGQTMCPFQDREETFFYRDTQGEPMVLHKATLQREKPEVTAEPREIFNVPSTEAAFFNLKLTNNSESGDDQWYALSVEERTNQKGAMILIDGELSQKLIYVPANSTVTKLVTIQPNDLSILDYENIGIILHSTCQFDPTDFTPDISDTVYISAHFQPSCTNSEILEPLNNWVVNVNDKDTMTVRIGNYNLSHNSFQSLRFEYKLTSGNIWIPVKYFVNDPLLANKDEIADTLLISNKPFVSFEWDMTGLKDRGYDIRVVSTCTDYSENESVIHSGILDGQRPQVFGTPQPADGILNVDENIRIRFNEPIEGSLLNPFNFDMKGTLNNYLLKHEAYLNMNGASDYAAIPEGINFNNKSFTIELWVKPDDYGSSVLLSQGNDPATSLEIGLRDGFKTYFKIGGVEFETDLVFGPAVPAQSWQHIAYSFNYETSDVYIYQNDVRILEKYGTNATYNNSGKIYVGKSAVTGAGNFEGSLHELRIWSKYLSLNDVYSRQYTALSGNEVGLYGYWPLDEAFGKLAIDKAASRHMEISAPWGAYPGGSSWNFSGNNFLEFNTGYFAIIPEMDYTIEFWFKDNNPTDTVTLFSNQKGDISDGTGLLGKSLSIYATPDGKIWVSSLGNKIEVVTTDYFDNSWHHFALIVRRRGNVTSFIDGQPQSERENTIIGGIAGGKMTLGARKWNNINGTGQDRFYTGKLDEFRLWNLSKTTTQLRMDMNSKLKGDEIGLLVYFPLEGYYNDAMGVVQQQTTLENFVTDVNALNAIPISGNAFSLDAPNMKDVRPVQSIAYDVVASEDEIILDPKSYLFPQLEKNIIEITVQGVEDKYGNRMASPVTWTAYVSRNQVRWEDERRSFTKELYKTMTFESTIKNTGGQQIGFEIIGLPPWLSASPSTGVINPESTRVITFTINPAINIGEYNADIILRTANGFDEKLPVSVKVFKTPPSWKVNPSAFEHTMNMVGRIKIEGVLSTDVFDMVAAFKEGTDSIRGVANIRYLEDLDSYMVFMNVYGNTNGEKLTFRIWDASAGQILDKVLPDDVVFVPNGVNGTTTNPVIFTAINLFRSYIPLAAGWNWVSFNKLSPDQNNLNTFMSSIESKPNDQIKTHGGGFNNYDPLLGWSFGGIESINNNLMYQIKISKTDTLIYNGTYIEPEAHQMTLANGWNHVAYIPDLLMDVNEALRLYSASAEEIIKSQYAFAMFDPRVGWIGTLEFMTPGFGYMIKTSKTATLKYPNTSLLKDAKIEKQYAPPSGWSANLVKYEGNMSVIARLETSKFPEVLINDQMVLGAFINKECHGYTVPLTNAGIDYAPFFLNVSNDKTDQQVQFRLYDGLSGNTYLIEETKVYAENAVYGSTLSPQILTLKGQYTGVNGELIANATLNCYPNPFNEGLTIDYNFAGGLMKLEIMDLTGRVINKLFDGISDPGLKSFVWDGKSGNGTAVSAGMYYVRLSAGKSVETVKITKNR